MKGLHHYAHKLTKNESNAHKLIDIDVVPNSSSTELKRTDLYRCGPKLKLKLN